MNINVGKLYNGWPILDAAAFKAKVTEPMKASGLPYASATGLGLPQRDSKGGFGLYKYSPTKNFPLDFASGASYDDSYIQASIAEQWGQLANAVDNPNAIFEYDDADPAGKDINKDRIRVFYYRTKNIVVPLGSKSYYQSSGWVGIRGGLIFVGGVVFGALGAPVLSSALSSAASGAAIDATIVTPTVATTVTTVANGEAQLFGDKNIALIGKAINLVNGQIGSSAVSTLGETAVDDIDFGDYDPVDYSSGESWTAFSDAENVDFGFDDQSTNLFADASSDDYSVVADMPEDNYSHEGVNFNGTAESNVSDYGSTSQGNPTYSPDDSSKLGIGPAAALPVAAALKKTPGPSVQATNPSGGGAKYAQTVTSAGSLLAQATAQSNGSAPAPSGLSGLLQQVESIIPRTYTGQLGANKTAPVPMSSNNMLLIGAGLIGIALLLHFKG